jgi:hypothetical protein
LCSLFLAFCYINHQEDASGLVDEERENLLLLRWRIYEPRFNYDALQFNLHYNVSDYVEDTYVSYTIYDGHGCSDGNNDVTALGYFDTRITPDATAEPGTGYGKREIELSTTLRPEIISNITDSSLYEAQGDNAAIHFCVRFSLYNNDPSNPESREISFSETKVTLFVSLINDFAIEDEYVAPKEIENQQASETFYVEGYLCQNKTSTKPLVVESPLEQGTAVKVCVKPMRRALEAGVRMRRIDSFTFARETNSQKAIVDGAPANVLTELSCLAGSSTCSFDTILMAAFFDGPGTVTGTGTASMQFGISNRRTRGLGSSDSSRREQAVTDELVVVFTLPDFEVQLSEYEFTATVPEDSKDASGAGYLRSSFLFSVMSVLLNLAVLAC